MVPELHLTSHRGRKSQDIKLRRHKEGWKKAMIASDMFTLNRINVY